MFLNEAEIRKVIRRRLMMEKAKEYEQSGGEIAGDVAKAAAGGVAGTAAIGAGLTIANVGSAAGAANLVGYLASGVAGGHFTAGSAAAAATGLSNPVGWGILASVAIGAGIAYILLDEGDVGSDIEGILNGTWAEKTNAELKKVEVETKKALQDAGMEEQLAKFPSLTHYNDIMDLHLKMAKRLYRATKGGFFGMGTDEDEIEKVIDEMPSLMDLSLTAASFKKQYKMDLVKVFNEELSDEESLGYTQDMETYVRTPIQNLKNKAVICFKDGNGEKKCYSEQELKAFSKEMEELIKNPPAPKPADVKKIDPNALQGNLVQRIQHIMNAYSETHNLGINISEDGKWGAQTDGLWEKFLNHVFSNHTTFKNLGYAKTYQSGMYQWAQVSKDMIGDFPGYVGNTRGCLAFVTDGYNGDTEYGSGNKKISGGGSGGGGGGRRGGGSGRGRGKVRDSAEGPQAQTAGGRRGGLVPKARVTLAGSGKNTLESIGFASGTTSELVSTVAQRVRGSITGGKINLKVTVDRNGVVRSVRPAGGQRRNPINVQFENLTGVVKTFLQKAGRIPSGNESLIEPNRIRQNRVVKAVAKSRTFELVLDFPAGNY